ncbi:MAG: M20 family metallopeptidase [Bacillota bacterium]|jgi:glutamate carboxypeptidase|nr:M20 family metallopeptidase [Candidatus Fermentithermobacillaceae bacterium]
MSDQDRILAHLKSYQDDMVKLLEVFTNTDSPSTDKSLMDAFAKLVAREWEGLDAKVTILEQDTYGNHVKVEVGSGDETILLLCHMDTVWDAGETQKRPFRVEDGKAYGPGVYDMKAGIVQAFFAVKTLKDLGLLPEKKIVVLHNSEEEIGSPSSRPIIEEEAKKASAVLVLEPTALGGSLKTWRKGVGGFTVSIKGRASHAGADYEKGVSAITEAAHQMLRLHGLTDLEAGTTVNVGVVSAGTRTNVVAENATLGVDLRIKTMDAANTIIPEILGLKPVHPEITLEVKGELNRPPMERTEGNVRLFELAQKIGREMGIEVTESGSGGGSDGNFTSALGIPTLDGLGAVGDGAHALTEHIIVSSLPERAAIVAGLLLKI